MSDLTERREIDAVEPWSPVDAATEVAQLLGARDDFVIDLRDGAGGHIYLRSMAPDVRGDEGGSTKPRLAAVRRMLDIGTASTALLLLLPVFAVVCGAAKLSRTGPIFFSQERVGRQGRIFRCIKFRSMYPDADERLAELLRDDADFRQAWLTHHKVANDPRVTPVGRWLRKTSLDELPQLINVLRGEMSIIGPRPVVPAESVRYGEALPKVLSVRPGLTGLWQCSGRNSLSYAERIALDVRYVERQSVVLDARILVKTVRAILTGHGAS
jgi:exopolysaccharide production protein ExoY